MIVVPIFSSQHLMLLLGCIISSFIVFVWFRQTSGDNIRKLEVLFGIFILVKTLVFTYLGVIIADINWFDNLPLHLCDITAILCAIHLIRPSQKVFEYCLFYGSIGAINAILTPILIHGNHFIFKADYVFQHSAILAIVLHMLFNQKFRLTDISLFRASMMSFAIIIPTHFINLFLNTNYIFTRFPPYENHPLVFGDWPYYFLMFISIGFVIAVILRYILKRLYPQVYVHN